MTQGEGISAFSSGLDESLNKKTGAIWESREVAWESGRGVKTGPEVTRESGRSSDAEIGGTGRATGHTRKKGGVAVFSGHNKNTNLVHSIPQWDSFFNFDRGVEESRGRWFEEKSVLMRKGEKLIAT